MATLFAGEGIGVEVREHVASKYRAAVRAMRDLNEALDALSASEREQFVTMNRHSETLKDCATLMFGQQVSMFG